ncbi:MAG TPA: hypothetical protein VFZ61_18930 [Polyangiales bacterium]
MEVVSLLLYVGAVWVLGAVGLFIWNVLARGHEHSDRLALLPLEDNWSDPLRASSTVSVTDTRREENP